MSIMMGRSALNSIRGSIGMGQGNIRNQETRSKDMNRYSSANDQVSWDNPGMQVSPQQTMGGFSGADPARNTFQQGGFSGADPARNTFQQGGSFGGPAPMPQFNNGQTMQGAYGQQLNRFMGRGGSFDQFRPRMGAQGPQYRNGMSARPFTPPPPQPPKPPDENINPPPPPVEYKSYVQPTFNMGY